MISVIRKNIGVIVSRIGKVFKNKITGIIGSELILLAKSDKITNYEETDKPIVEQENVDIDSTETLPI
jgi:hypothetical protein